MKYHVFLTVALLVAAWTTGCGGEPATVAPQDELVASQEPRAKLLEPREATMTLTPEPTEVKLPPEAEPLVQLAREDLSRKLGLAPEAIQLVSVEAAEWSDASLGCPQPGMMYAQVITPGFLVVLEAEGREYEYHTDTGDQVVFCQPEEGGERSVPALAPAEAEGSDPRAVAGAPAEAKQVVNLAVEDLAEKLGLAPGTFQLVSVEAMNWRDASLGCPQPGMMYAQVITPGFLVVLEAEGQEYEYHTDEGRFAVLCEE